MTSGSHVYLIRNVVNNDLYVGKANDPQHRYDIHIDSALKGSTALPHFYNAIRKFGAQNFVLEVQDLYPTEDDAYEAERVLIREFRKSGQKLYNVSAGGRGGRRYTYEQRRTHSEIQRSWSRTSRARTKNSIAQNRSDVRRAKSESMKHRWESDPDLRQRHLESITTPELLQQQSERQKAAWRDPVQRRKMSEGMNKPEFKRAQKERLSHEGNPMAKLSWELVDQIRADFELHSSIKQLMEDFPQVSYCTLRRIVTKKAWVRR